MITGTFEGRRWSVPALVYAAPLELYPGARLTAGAFEAELHRLGYQQREALRPGSYRRRGNRFDVHLRSFRFMERQREARRIALTFDATRLGTLTAAGEPVALLRLEPAVVGSFFPSHGEDRIVLPPAQVPELLRKGLIVVEDRKFMAHPGFDPVAIARAFWVNLRAGELQQGGSTLTQQLVKSYFLDNRRTLRRKLKELFMAVVLDARYSKEEILNAYINEIFLGQDGTRAVHGFGLGAEFYFNKRLNDLTADEIATLICIIRGPSYYNPRRHPERARERRNLVLRLFSEHGLIDDATYQKLRAEPLGVTATRGGNYHPAFMDLVRDSLAREFDPGDLESEGLRVFTTLDTRLQGSAQRALTRTIEHLEQSRNLADGKLQGAVVVTRAQTGDVLAVVGGRDGGEGGFNRALEARRPVGSLIKPVVYLTALEQERYHLATVVEDKAVSLPLDRNRRWEPDNFDEQTHGPMPLVQALARSLNLATVHVGMDVGVERVAERLGTLLDTAPPPAYPSLLLGAVELTPLDVSQLYGHFASGGFATPPKAVLAVLNEAGAPLSRYQIDIEASLTRRAVTELRSALGVAMARGTGRSSPFAQAGVAGKTGTSNDYRDSWFAGFDDTLLTVVWLGRDDNQPVGLTGSSGPLKVWDRLISETGIDALYNWSDDVREAEIEWSTGLEARESCAETVKVLVPLDAELPVKPGCGLRAPGRAKRRSRWFGG